MYRIIHLSWDEERKNYQAEATDYEPMSGDDVWVIVQELTEDAIESNSLDRWSVEADQPN